MSDNKSIKSIALKYFDLDPISIKYIYIVLCMIKKSIIKTIKNIISEYQGFCLYLRFNRILKDNNVSFYIDEKHNEILNLVDANSSKYNRCTMIQGIFEYLQGTNLNDLRLWYYDDSEDEEISEMYDKEKTLALLHHCQDKGRNFIRNLSIYLPNEDYININLRDAQGRHFNCIDKIYIFESFHYVILGGYVLGVKDNNYVIRYYILGRNKEYELLNEVYVKDIDKLNPGSICQSVSFNHSGLTLVYDNFKRNVIEFKDPPYYLFNYVYFYSNEYRIIESNYCLPTYRMEDKTPKLTFTGREYRNNISLLDLMLSIDRIPFSLRPIEPKNILATLPSSEPVHLIKQYHSGVYPIRTICYNNYNK